MTKPKATTVDAYLAALPDERREMMEATLDVIRRNLDPAFDEGMQYGMPAFFLPHSEYPAGYHCDPEQPLPYASVANTKAGVSIYLFCIYTDPEDQERFVRDWKATGKRLDMGKSCIRVKKLEGIALDVVGAAVKRATPKRFIAAYEKIVPAAARKPAKKSAKPAAKATSRKSSKKTR